MIGKNGNSKSNDGRGANWPLWNFLTVLALGGFITIAHAREMITTAMIIEMAKEFGLPGIILVLWFISNRNNQRNMQQYHNDVVEMRQMYVNNVSLVEKYGKLSSDLKEVIIMNTQAMTNLCKDVECALKEK